MINTTYKLLLLVVIFAITACSTNKNEETRVKLNFNKDWTFFGEDEADAMQPDFDDSSWRKLNVPHDWSIEEKFGEEHPAGVGGGALPGGIAWYRKKFTVSEAERGKLFFIDFDGVYTNSEVWINGHYLGFRPNGYISFRYELTPHLNYGEKENVISVKVNNAEQPNSRWYSGSGIYRNVWLTKTNPIFVDNWGTFVTTPEVSNEKAKVSVNTRIINSFQEPQNIILHTLVLNAAGKEVVKNSVEKYLNHNLNAFDQELLIKQPSLWSVEDPYLYKVITKIEQNGKLLDEYETTIGIRSFDFDVEKGFILNGKQVKIKGVCNHHDLGSLGAAINTRAIERQLEIMKEMGVNGIRTAHNPPAPELLDLCDKMGFIVMNEAYDMWKKGKSKFDYSLYWDEWYVKDLEDLVLRDRNHPSIFMWSIGNEILEQWDTTGISIASDLANIVKRLDSTRPITSAMNDPKPHNNIIKSGVLDLIGYNYNHKDFEAFPEVFPGQKFIATETTSALATRGSYDQKSDSIRRWPIRWDLLFTEGNADHTCSAYDNCSTPWGSTHEETWKVIKKHDYLSGMYIWTGFDYLGEPTPYVWPARSSYFGIVDLAGFPKDAFYMYQSEWTDNPVLHVFPHWNWKEGDVIDMVAYYNYADEVELFLNGESLGKKSKKDDDVSVMWRVNYGPGTIKAVSRLNGKEVLVREVKTAGEAAKIVLEADRKTIKADGEDLSFITVKIVDKDGNVVPRADNLVNFEIEGNAFIAGVDNGLQTSHEPFKANYRKAFNGLCLAIVQAKETPGKVKFKAISEGLESASVELILK